MYEFYAKKDDLQSSFLRESAGARTRDPNIKSVVLYLLSYGFIVCAERAYRYATVSDSALQM